MFSLEITFADGAGDSETVFVQRPHAIVGASDYSHVVIGDLTDFPYELHLFRGIGRSFRTVPVVVQSNLKVDIPQHLSGEYDGEANLDLGTLQVLVTALDSDLGSMKNEAVDKAAARILRRACQKDKPYLPAVSVTGDSPVAVSFAPDLPLVIGRDRESHLRLDAPDVSGKHANITYEHDEFFIEDLGSTNGTFVSGQQVSGKMQIPAGEPIVVGRSIVAYVLDKEGDVEVSRETPDVELRAIPEERYPMLISLSEVVRPQRLVVPHGQTVRVGREPSSDMWLGAPHVSRKHCTIDMMEKENLILTDLSLNGLAYDGGVLTQGESVEVQENPCVLNFGGGVTVAICFTEEQEQHFIDSDGNPSAFRATEHMDEGSQASALATQAAVSFDGAEAVGAPKQRGVGGLRRRFMALRLNQRIIFLFAVFIVLLACALFVKLTLPILY